MKTKVIKVWVNSDNLSDNYKRTSIHWSKEEADKMREKHDNQYGATLVIEVPDKKITITRSELIDKIGKIEFSGFRQYSREVADNIFGKE